MKLVLLFYSSFCLYSFFVPENTKNRQTHKILCFILGYYKEEMVQTFSWKDVPCACSIIKHIVVWEIDGCQHFALIC